MPQTIQDGFKQLRSNLEITDLQRSTVSTTQQAVRAAVEKGFAVLDSFLTGSYARHTLIAPLSDADIDVFVILDPKYYSSAAPKTLLATLRDTLNKTYPNTPQINRSGQAVRITFTKFRMDVVPAFYRNGGGYLILSDTLDKWIPTDPKKHELLISNSNTAHDGDLIPICKMIKGWNKNNGDHLRSFYLELLTEKVLSGVTISNDWSGVRFVFDKAKEAVRFTIPDPAGFGENISGLIDINVNQAVNLMTNAHQTALAAEALDLQGKTPAAYAQWQELFGDYYPSYR